MVSLSERDVKGKVGKVVLRAGEKDGGTWLTEQEEEERDNRPA